jgi:UDP-N-acetylmuramoylalanine--D-glutamate ligase
MQTMSQTNSVHQNQRYLVVGLGLSGFSAARYLLQHGYDCRVIDDREQPPYAQKLKQQFPLAEIMLGDLNEELLNTVDCLVVSPGLSIRTASMKKVAESGKRLIGDIELFAEAVDKPVLAITGSNGKSTVTTLLGKMIAADNRKVAVGGNIGVPALDLLDQPADFYVLELSSFQLETVHSLKPLAATVLNISEDHLDRYDGLQDYQATKKHIYDHATHCLSNADDALTRHDQNDILFSLKNPAADYALIGEQEKFLGIRGEAVMPVAELKLKGQHNVGNCLAAMALADFSGVSRFAMISAMKSFAGLPHRSQWIAEIDGVAYINDSKATNPGAAKAAIDGQQQPVILIAGGQAKGANVDSLCESLKQHVKTVLLMGQDAGILQQSWQDCVEIKCVDDMQQALQSARDIAQPGDLVLLSPACASFDMYSGFDARGDHFAQLVRAMQ